MPDSEQPVLTPEAIHRVAQEIAGARLSEAEIEALLPILTMLLSDAEAAQTFDRSGLEPQIRFVLEEWPP
jgi:hypothetical protein